MGLVELLESLDHDDSDILTKEFPEIIGVSKKY